MSCSLKSAFDKETYEDYLDGKRRYFTVNGMEIDSTAQEKTPIDFLKHKYRNHDDYPVTTEIVKSYVDLYNMESGVIFSPDQLIISATKYVGCIAYIENDFVFMSYIVCLREFAQAENKKTYVKESFKPQGLWSYENVCVESMGTNYYDAHITIKSLLAHNSLLSQRIETIAKNSHIDVMNYQVKSTKSINKCHNKIHYCINKLDTYIIKCEKRDTDTILICEMMIVSGISLGIACILVIMLFVV